MQEIIVDYSAKCFDCALLHMPKQYCEDLKQVVRDVYDHTNCGVGAKKFRRKHCLFLIYNGKGWYCSLLADEEGNYDDDADCVSCKDFVDED